MNAWCFASGTFYIWHETIAHPALCRGQGIIYMSASEQPTRFGQISPPDEAWLARQPPEPILDPDLPIIDPHHHLWDRPQHRYLLDEFLADVRTGHRLVATVFEECHSMYRASGPEELRPVGETEFVAGIAAMSASDLYGPTRVAAGIVGFADLTLGHLPQRRHEAWRHDESAGSL
jgi:L-fuconolactonase